MVALTACSPIAASGRAQAAAPARSLQIAAPRPQRAALRPAAARRRWACRATAEKEGSSSAQGTEAQPQVPAAGGDQQQAQQPSAASQLNQVRRRGASVAWRRCGMGTHHALFALACCQFESTAALLQPNVQPLLCCQAAAATCNTPAAC